jgi:membrane protein implicated in regulation of membrane protease activity
MGAASSCSTATPELVLALSILLAVLVLEEPWSWVAVGLGAAFELGETGFLIWWSKRRRVAVGSETLIGRHAVVSFDCMPEGQVKVDGEIWRARCAGGAGVGDEVVIREVDGLTLVVEGA